MDDQQQIRDWTKQRYEYYVAGRTLWFNNQMEMGAMMLAYSVEAHMKQVLSQQKKPPRKLLYGHDILGLFEKSTELNLFTDLEVSNDLLRYAQDNFHRRYPSQTRETIQDAMSRGHCLAMDPCLIFAYDDLILQLDESVYRYSGTVKASIAARGATLVDCFDGRLFFHCNYPAIDRLEYIIKLHEEALSTLLKEEPEKIHEINKRSHKGRLVILSDKNKLLTADIGLVRVSPAQGSKSPCNYANDFTYPGRYYELEDGSRVWTTIKGPEINT